MMTTDATGMRYRPLGSSGLMVSVVGLGTNNVGRRLDLDATRAVVDAALDAGINLFDTADIYGGGASETLLGQVLEGRRDEAVIATKFSGDMGGSNGPSTQARGSRGYIRRAIDASLRRMRTDHIDLYQYHAPDRITPIEETLAALDELVTEGKVRYIGSSNLDAWQVVEADWIARRDRRTRFISAQNEYSLLERGAEAELAPACERYGVGIMPYFPLASGLLTGKYRRDRPRPAGTRLEGRDGVFTDAAFDVIEALAAFADTRGITMLDAAIGGLAAQPAVASVIAGAMSPDQVRANAKAGLWEPSPEDLVELDRAAPRGA
jgi:aryl-alcohol dehydrogenase-like predicted oxidoreductase